MNPVVHFEMPYDDRARMARFYETAFGWKTQSLGEEMGNYVTAATTETGPAGPLQPGAINGGFFARKADWPAQVPSVVIAVDDIRRPCGRSPGRWHGAGRADGDSGDRPVRVVHGHGEQPRQHAAAVAAARAARPLRCSDGGRAAELAAAPMLLPWRRRGSGRAQAATPSRNGRGASIPRRSQPESMLAWYAERLPAVEINNTFYQMPKVAVLAQWVEATPDAFRFAIKASRRITHDARLKADAAADSVAYLYKNLGTLGAKRGPVLFQLPPFLKKDLPRLNEFLQLLPDGHRAAFEFRNESWFDDDVYAALQAAGAALCLSEREDNAPPPLVETAPWGYLRLRLEDYSEDDLSRWVRGSRQRVGRRPTCTSCMSRRRPDMRPRCCASRRPRDKASSGASDYALPLAHRHGQTLRRGSASACTGTADVSSCLSVRSGWRRTRAPVIAFLTEWRARSGPETILEALTRQWPAPLRPGQSWRASPATWEGRRSARDARQARAATFRWFAPGGGLQFPPIGFNLCVDVCVGRAGSCPISPSTTTRSA